MAEDLMAEGLVAEDLAEEAAALARHVPIINQNGLQATSGFETCFTPAPF